MLTILKQIFTWWNHQTFGTRLQIFFFWKISWEKIKMVINIMKVNLEGDG